MVINSNQLFDDLSTTNWQPFGDMVGVNFVTLAEPVPQGSIHRARLTKGTIIPPHTHLVDEYVYVVSGEIKTGGRHCTTGTFWTTPANVRQGPHIAMTDVEILTIRLGALGIFET